MPREERLPRRYAANPSDVFAMVKHDLCDSNLSQPALLVWPGDERARTATFLQNGASHQGVYADVDEERASQLLELAEALKVYPQFGRAISYMKGLAGQHARTRRAAHPLNFLSSGGRAVMAPIDGALPARPDKPDPYKMKVRFHRPRDD